MRVHVKRLCAAALLVLALQPVYLLALVATDYVAPAELRRERMTHLPPPPNGGDDTIECVALAIGFEPGGVGLHNAIMAARPLSQGTPCDSLPATIAKDPAVTWLPYPRYWHGYRVVLDPLTAWLPMYPVRYLMLAAMIAALTWFAFELRTLVGADAALALIVPTVVLTDLWINWNYAAQTIAIIVIFAGSAVAARKARDPDSNLILIAAVFGSLFNYVDFLVNVPWQPMLIAFVALAARRRAPETFAIVVAWFGAYALTWASKWAIAVAAGASWRDIFEVITYRLNGDAPGYVRHHFLAPTRKVLNYLYHETRSAMLFLVLLPTLLLPVRRPNPGRFALLSSPLLIPFVWFEILSNHTQIHTWMVYRTVASCFGILIAAAIIASREEPAGSNVAQQKSAE
ncbi:MAG TPA: hypothetical protein VGH70_08625 [Bradyrhizobium sp.]|jgi:hypothetical protein